MRSLQDFNSVVLWIHQRTVVDSILFPLLVNGDSYHLLTGTGYFLVIINGSPYSCAYLGLFISSLRTAEYAPSLPMMWSASTSSIWSLFPRLYKRHNLTGLLRMFQIKLSQYEITELVIVYHKRTIILLVETITTWMSDGLSLDQQQQVCAQSAGQHGDKTLRLIEKKISHLSVIHQSHIVYEQRGWGESSETCLLSGVEWVSGLLPQGY